MRGFIFSIIAISFMLLLVFLAVTMANEYWETERLSSAPQPLTYASATLSNIGVQFADIVLPDAGIFTGNESVRVRIADTVPRAGISSKLNTLRNYVENDIADSLHAQIDVNTSGVSSGSLNLSMMQGFLYQSCLNDTQEVYFRTIENASASGMSMLFLNISVSEYRNDVDDFDWDAGGAINLTMRYTDKNGTVLALGSLDPDELNTMTITYGENETEWVEINIGRVRSYGNHYDGAFFLNMSNSTEANFEFDATLPLQPSASANTMVFPITMNYSQGGVYKEINVSR